MIYHLRVKFNDLLMWIIGWKCWGWPMTSRLMWFRHSIDPSKWCEKCKNWVPKKHVHQ